jgi:hypothetical protein
MTHADHLVNCDLVLNATHLRQVIDEWAKTQSSASNIAHARVEFEQSILDAIQNKCEWQQNTGSDLCTALGHMHLVDAIYEL